MLKSSCVFWKQSYLLYSCEFFYYWTWRYNVVPKCHFYLRWWLKICDPILSQTCVVHISKWKSTSFEASFPLSKQKKSLRRKLSYEDWRKTCKTPHNLGPMQTHFKRRSIIYIYLCILKINLASTCMAELVTVRRFFSHFSWSSYLFPCRSSSSACPLCVVSSTQFYPRSPFLLSGQFVPGQDI